MRNSGRASVAFIACRKPSVSVKRDKDPVDAAAEPAGIEEDAQIDVVHFLGVVARGELLRADA